MALDFKLYVNKFKTSSVKNLCLHTVIFRAPVLTVTFYYLSKYDINLKDAAKAAKSDEMAKKKSQQRASERARDRASEQQPEPEP